MEQKTELLAPAGNYEAFLGAFHAGADAFYLAGQRFGARAYADNFSEEEICRALRLSHYYGKKIYLTVNTLVKEKELDGLEEYLRPLYEAGLDGVIVQDFGVLRYIRRHFPDLELHASTQMTLTGKRGAALLKDEGVCRIVPARELSLEEIRILKQETGMEIECFVHGAMCYCYSGQCLFSSILGGRSGNRGRCAQPCRLPYRVYLENQCIRQECYPLSLKDMCTLEYLPKLIDAGIDSFKIEGRMKKPEYAAGVTALYRKYIDLYRRDSGAYQVDPEDLAILKNLYIRSEIQTGYYERHNGKEMITLQKPSYLGSDETLLARLRERYIHELEKDPVTMKAHLCEGVPATLEICGSGGRVQVSGDVVMRAQKSPLTEDTLKKQLSKTGNSLIRPDSIELLLEGEVFLPVKSLNALRRDAVQAYEDLVIGQNRLCAGRQEMAGAAQADEESGFAAIITEKRQNRETKPYTDCLVCTLEQLTEVLQHKNNIRRVYIDSDLYLKAAGQIDEMFAGHVSVDGFLALPYIIRHRDENYLERLKTAIGNSPYLKGFLARNLEAVAFLEEILPQENDKVLVADAGLYCMNREALSFLAGHAGEITFPYELNAGECRQLGQLAAQAGVPVSLIVYGRIPMMVTANCVRKTTDNCLLTGAQAKAGQVFLKDRMQAMLPVSTNCMHCYNILYNALPYSLHLKKKERERILPTAQRFDFTMETRKEVAAILAGETFPFPEYTTGHFQRGIE